MTGLVNRKQQSGKPNLYLVGFMGVGKSAVGQRVAAEMRYQFFDSDVAIEKKTGKSIPKIFATEGESSFRNYEREFIDSGHPAEGCVISCGGGLILQEGMQQKLKTKGVVICLFASIETIIERTGRNNNRPLLNVADPEARIRQLFAERESTYLSSGACISTENRSFAEIVKHVIRTYKSYNP